MDIQDILDSVSEDTAPAESDLQSLVRAWVNERVAPEILPFPEPLIERTMERMRKQLTRGCLHGAKEQIELLEEQTGTMDPKTSFRLIIIQTELERFKFLLRSFLRARIAKVDKYPLHILKHPDQQSRLSSLELQYLTDHHALLSNHYHASFLAQFPQPLQRLDDTAGGISMIDGPDEDTAVFCRVLQDVGIVTIEGTDSTFEMNKGDIYIVRWSSIRENVMNGNIELV